MLKVPFRCTATTASQSSSAMLKIIRSRRMPALLTTMLSLPKVSSAHWTMRLAALKSATLSPLATAWPPIFLISATTSCAGVAVGAPVPSKCAPRSFTTTFAPCFARSSASSRPMPRPEPVTIATLPSSNIGEPPLEFGEPEVPAQPARLCQGERGRGCRLIGQRRGRAAERALWAERVRLALRIVNVLVALVTLASALAVLVSDLRIPGYREHYRDAVWFVGLYTAVQGVMLVTFARDGRLVPWLALSKAVAAWLFLAGFTHLWPYWRVWTPARYVYQLFEWGADE